MNLTDNEIREAFADFETRISRLENMTPYQYTPVESLPELKDEVIHMPDYQDIIKQEAQTRKLAEEARVIAGANREIIQEHVSHTDKKYKSKYK